MVDMTEGNPTKKLVAFAAPLMLGNVFQQLYNCVDSIIVGRYVSDEAFAAVGCANPIMSIAVFIIVGMCMGASVLMSELFGAGEVERLKRQISTAVACGTLFTAVVSLIAVLFVKQMLVFIHTPEELIEDAAAYLVCIFGGLVFTFLFNIYSAQFRAIGDSREPLYFLIISSVLHVFLDLLFVIIFRMRVMGTALATVLSQACAVILCIVYIQHRVPILRVKKSDYMKPDWELFRKTANYSYISAMQQSCLYIGRLLVQGAVNPLGVSTIAAYSAVTRIDGFILVPGDSIADSVTTYTAQNRGSGKKERIYHGIKGGNLVNLSYCAVIAAAVFLFAGAFMRIFIGSGSLEVIAIGKEYLHVMSLFYVLSGVCNVFQGFFRGMGLPRLTLYATTLQIIIRVIVSYCLSERLGIAAVALGVIAGWLCMAGFQIAVYIQVKGHKIKMAGIKA